MSGLGRTEAEIDEMPWTEAKSWFAVWERLPPAAESLARIAARLGAWKPPRARLRASTEQELMAFALFSRGAMGG